MKIIKVNELEVEANEVVELNLCENKPGDTVTGDIYLDVQESNTVTVKGSVDGNTWHELKVVDMANYSLVSSISGTGYFMIPAAGLAKAEFTFGSAGKVVIKETY